MLLRLRMRQVACDNGFTEKLPDWAAWPPVSISAPKGTMNPRQYGDFQFDIYRDGLQGIVPRWPVDFAALETKASEVLPWWVYSYVAGGCGDEHTQRANVDAFCKWGLVPRMCNGAYERDVSVSLFGVDLPTPIFMCPIGVIGLCAQDFHGDLQVADAVAETGVPMVTSTLSMDRHGHAYDTRRQALD
jgi:lactate 2-monooxygenase